jgi:DNA-binding NtrC family response regulator
MKELFGWMKESFIVRRDRGAFLRRSGAGAHGTVFAGFWRMQTNPQGHTTAEPSSDDSPTLDVLRLRYIHRAIEHTNNNKTRAAELLGIDRRTLNRILARERARRRAGGDTH